MIINNRINNNYNTYNKIIDLGDKTYQDLIDYKCCHFNLTRKMFLQFNKLLFKY